jgi:hypothetical protein
VGAERVRLGLFGQVMTDWDDLFEFAIFSGAIISGMLFVGALFWCRLAVFKLEFYVLDTAWNFLTGHWVGKRRTGHFSYRTAS